MFSVFFFKQKTAYEMRIRDWSSDVCSSDLEGLVPSLLISSLSRDEGRGPPRDSTIADTGAGWRQEESPHVVIARSAATKQSIVRTGQIGGASGRERVCQYV